MVVGELSQEADLLVIGGGPGGYAAAFRAARLGIPTTIIEQRGPLGGTCLHVGCIPSKSLLSMAEIITLAANAKQFGLEFTPPEIKLDRIRAWQSQVIDKLSRGLTAVARKLNVERVQGRARFESSKTVTVTGGDVSRIKFRRAVIAVGSAPVVLPDIQPDSPRVMNSSRALALEDIPERLLVLGGGYIGLELGQVYAALGSRVTVVEMMDALLPGVDPDLTRPLAKRLAAQFDDVCLNTRVVRMTDTAKAVKVAFEGDRPPKTKTYDRVLVSVGRRPNTDRLGLEKTKVRLDRGFIKVNAQCRTDDPKIYAVGDCAGNPMLAHKAVHEGHVCADVIAGRDAVFDRRAIPAVVFTDPEIAWTGLTERQAKERKIPVEAKKMQWVASGRAVAVGRTDGLTKILFDPDTQRVLGVGMVGPHVGEMIAESCLAIEMGAVATDLAETVHPHPTLSETISDVADSMLMQYVTTKRPPS